ncbi:MAG: hypothetical protein KAW41_03130 [Candidatus Diapherotrites archaeon]|nr:hypothetical protein [Candidatus Diapherotrites archaeon]
MDEGELVEFLYMLFGVGIVALAAYPKLFATLLPFVAMVGAFYLVWGVLSRIVSGVMGFGGSRRDDWWNGLAILTVVVLIYGQAGVAVNSVTFLLNLIWTLVVGIFALAL